LVVVFICLLGAIYFLAASPHRRPPEVTSGQPAPPVESVAAS
jgi:hypothetical protein